MFTVHRQTNFPKYCGVVRRYLESANPQLTRAVEKNLVAVKHGILWSRSTSRVKAVESVWRCHAWCHALSRDSCGVLTHSDAHVLGITPPPRYQYVSNAKRRRPRRWRICVHQLAEPTPPRRNTSTSSVSSVCDNPSQTPSANLHEKERVG